MEEDMVYATKDDTSSGALEKLGVTKRSDTIGCLAWALIGNSALEVDPTAAGRLADKLEDEGCFAASLIVRTCVIRLALDLANKTESSAPRDVQRTIERMRERIERELAGLLYDIDSTTWLIQEAVKIASKTTVKPEQSKADMTVLWVDAPRNGARVGRRFELPDGRDVTLVVPARADGKVGVVVDDGYADDDNTKTTRG